MATSSRVSAFFGANRIALSMCSPMIFTTPVDSVWIGRGGNCLRIDWTMSAISRISTMSPSAL